MHDRTTRFSRLTAPRHTAAILTATLCWATPALGQPEPGETRLPQPGPPPAPQPASEPTDSSTPPLAGPAVDAGERRTLINRSMSQDFVRLSDRPEIAVIELLDLPDDVRAEARSLGEDRVVRLAMFLVDRIDDLRAITDDITAGRAEAARQKTRNLWNIHDPDARITPLLDDLARIIGPRQAAEAEGLISDYLDAWIASARLPNETNRETRERLAYLLFQEELRAAYEISLENTRRALDAIYDAVEPTPEQREHIRSIIIEHIKQTRLQATTEQRRAVMRSIYDSLDEERRGRLFDYAIRVVLP